MIFSLFAIRVCFFLVLLSSSSQLFASDIAKGAGDKIDLLADSSEEVDSSKAVDIKQLVEEADELEQIGNLKGAALLLDKAKRLHEAANNTLSHDYSYVLFSLGVINFELENYKAAEDLLAQELSISIKLDGQNHSNVAITYVRLGETLYAQQKYSSAKDHYLSALQIQENIFGEYSIEIGEVLFLLGALYIDVGDFGKAANVYRREIKILESNLEVSSIHLAFSLNNLAYALASDGYLEEAKFNYSVPCG